MMHGRSGSAVPSPKGLKRRDEIVGQVLAMIGDDPWGTLTLRGIARELNMETSHLLHYFANKDGLFQAVILRWNSDFRDRDEGLSYIQRLPSVLSHNARVPGIVKLYTELVAASASPEHPSHDFFRERFENLRRVLSSEIQQLQERGVVSVHVDPLQTATRLLAFSDGLQMQWLVDRNVDMVQEMTSFIQDALGVNSINVLKPR